MPSSLPTWLWHPAMVCGALVFSLIAVVASLILVPKYLARLPCDYLISEEHHRASRSSVPLRVVKNLLGLVLVTLGALMLVLPGQGLITLMVGVMLLDFPGKQKLLQRALGQRNVLGAVNGLRQRAGKPPLTGPY
jgi:hypothetical protein